MSGTRKYEEHLITISKASGITQLNWQGCGNPILEQLPDELLASYEFFRDLWYSHVKTETFILEVLRLQDEYDCYGEPIYWATHGDYAPITFFVLCNDLFYWATADAEKLTPEDIPMLRQAILDVKATGAYELLLDSYEIGCMLWCARKRKMRPQQPAYPKDARLRALFDACGPARTPAEEG